MGQQTAAMGQNAQNAGQQDMNIAGMGGCCHQDTNGMPVLRSGCVPADSVERMAQVQEIQDASFNMVGGLGREWHCLRAEDGPDLERVDPASSDMLESLSYSPVRYEAATTIDVERSQARYSNLVVHSSRARLQRRSKVWEDWLRAATAGRNVTLIAGFPEETPRPGADGAKPVVTCRRIPAKYFLDRALTRISILPVEQMGETPGAAVPGETVLVDSIQVICTATDFMLFADHVESQLEESERSRAVLLQYIKDSPKGQRRRICFLEASPADKDRFVQALTALWLEKRNDHSTWF